MAIPTSRHTFKNYCLRSLGYPVIEINVDDDQIEDRIDEALKYYADYHFDASEKTYYKHQVTSDDKINKYIFLPENYWNWQPSSPSEKRSRGRNPGNNLS